ncbi:M3 family oligoendopeptidase [Bacillus sp. KH172YL63]|uniref:M3 family oligoendopeptidase n=1 Tax=Bacillus sp. KH172YL63 TaxID=2709784 RepID=UPI0013E455D9|nr:M3 family oligoendopeptidase [Bacillus sp. KH172YL63]BCB04172.1 oligoendopeptidase [Bacillus sp. KH172YL63]
MKKLRMRKWDLLNVRPGYEGIDLYKQILDMISQIDQTQQHIEGIESPEIKELVMINNRIQDLYTQVFHMDEYLFCLYAEDVHDVENQALADHGNRMKARMDTLMLAYSHFLADIPEEEWHLFIQHPEVSGTEGFLTEKRQRVKDLLAPEIEKVIHSLSVHGFEGWVDQYEQEYAKLTVPVRNGEQTEHIPIERAYISAVLADDRGTRQEIASTLTMVCKENAERFASIFNHFAGYRNELYRLRGWEQPLKEMLEQNRISEESIDSMMNVLHKQKGMVQSFLERKAQLIGVEKVSWYDLYAPTFTAKTTLTYEDAMDIVVKQFYGFSDKLGKFAERAFEEGWVDAEPLYCKRHGAFCASFPRSKESRVMLSFTGNYQDVVTLAHELGHAYHNSLLHEEPGFSHNVGTGLAETASTFAENLVLDAAIEAAETVEDRLSLLEMKITNGLKYIAYITGKFEFEQAFYEKRSHGKLSAGEIVQLMEKTERDWFGDALEDVHPYNWMTIAHFFNTEKAFYNLPYTIGYLFSNGIYSLYQQEKQSFSERYDKLLRQSGNRTMEDLGEAFLQSDLRDASFWEASIEPLQAALDQFMVETEKYI